MKLIATACLLLLSAWPHGPALASGHSDGPVLALPALWVAGMSSRRDFGLPPRQLPTQTGKLTIEDHGIRYVESSQHPAPDLLAIPYEHITSSRAEATEHGYDLLFVTVRGTPPNAHLFLLPHTREAEPGAFASEAKALIENLMKTAAPAAGGGVREERIRVSTLQWPATVVFGEPESPAISESNRFADTVVAGAKAGVTPVAVVCWAGCPPEALVFIAPLAAAGAAAGAVVGIGREIASLFRKNPADTAGFSPDELGAAAPLLVTAVIETLGGSAFRACVQDKLTVGREKMEPLRWSGDGRVATLMPAEEAARDSFHYAVEIFLSSVVLVPGEVAGQEAGGVPASLVVGAGLRIHDPRSGTSREISTEWRGESRTLHEWAESDGTLLKEALGKGCDALADQLLTESRIAWLGL